MGKMLVVIDSDTKVAALKSQLGDDCETYVLSSPPLKVSRKQGDGGKQSGKDRFFFTLLEPGKPLLKKLREYVDDEIYLAFDHDPRGEFLSWLVTMAMEIDMPGKTLPPRLFMLAIHEEELRESLNLVEPVNDYWAIGFNDRAIFDIAFGQHVKRLLGTQVGPAGVPLTMQCMVTIMLLAEREMEIKTNAKRPKQQLKVNLAAGDVFFPASLVFVEEISGDGYFYDNEDIEQVQRLLANTEYIVNKVKKTPLQLEPPIPYRLVDLLEDAFVVHGISLGKTMRVVQRLFAGVEVENESIGLISTYHPIDIPITSMVDNIRNEVEQLYGAAGLMSDGTIATGEGLMLPVRPGLSADKLSGILDEDESRVYELIRTRALASQMKAAKGSAIEVEIRAGEKCLFKASGIDISDPGYLSVFSITRGADPMIDSPLAHLQEGHSLPAEKVVALPALSFLSSFYTIESLFVDLADYSISPGVVAVNMLHQLVEGGYVEILSRGELRCRENINKVTSTLDRAFPTMRGINLPAYLEQTISEVVSGRKELDFALLQFDQTMKMKGNVLWHSDDNIPLSAQVEARLRKRKPKRVIKGGAAPSSAPQPTSGLPKVAELEDLTGLDPRFDQDKGSGLVAEPDLDTEKDEPVVAEAEVIADEATVEPVAEAVAEAPPAAESVAEDAAAPSTEAVEAVEADVAEEVVVADEAPTVQEEEEISSVDLALSGVNQLADEVPELAPEEVAEVFDEVVEPPPAQPEVPAPPPVDFLDAKGMGIECPVCRKGRILKKTTPAGKPFYVCPVGECEFMAWAPPHGIPCQVCGSPFLVEKDNLHGQTFLRCPRAGCNYRQPLPGDDGSALLAEEQEGVKKKRVVVRRSGKGGSGGGTGKKKVVVRRRK